MRDWFSKRRNVRILVFVLVAPVALVALVLAYFWIQGSRELERELALLRASGAPEFPEQLRFDAPSSGEDPLAWWKALDAEWAQWDAADVEECRERLGAGESVHELERDLDLALRDPRRVGALTACEVAVLEARWKSESAQLQVASGVDRLAPVDWRAVWEIGKEAPPGTFTDGVLGVPPAVAGFLLAIDVLGHDAVRYARRGNPTGARLRLRQGWTAIVVHGEPQNFVGFLAWSTAITRWWEHGCLPVLHLLGSDGGAAEFEALLRGLDVRARLRGALQGERAMGNRIYRTLREAALQDLVRSQGWASDWLTRHVWLDHDQAAYLGLLRAGLAAVDSSPSLASWDAIGREQRTLAEGVLRSYRRPVSSFLAPKLEAAGLHALGFEARVLLARAALVAHADGAAAAEAWLAGRVDPFDGRPLRARLDPDGILVLWSVGPDGANDPVEPPTDDEAPSARDDVIVRIRSR